MSIEYKRVRQLALRSLIATGVIALTACDGSVVGDPSSTSSANGAISEDGQNGTMNGKGTLFSHRAAGATVCFDLNYNTRCDALEPTDITAEDGSFSLQPASSPMPLVAELPATEDSPAVSLYAAAGSSTISALTTIHHWYSENNPTLPPEQVTAQLKELLSLSSLDVAQQSEQQRAGLNDAGLGAVNADSIDTDAAQQAAEHLARVRQTLEAFIAKIEATATDDALAAGIDPGLADTQQRLSHLVAAHSLQQLPDLADAIVASDEISPEAIAAGLPAPLWAANNIQIALQGVVLEALAEADPISLISDTLTEIELQCGDSTDCDLILTAHSSDDGESLKINRSIVYAANRREAQPARISEISNLILTADGVWKSKDSSGEGSLSRTAEYKATLVDHNNTSFELTATSRDIGGTPLLSFSPYNDLTQVGFLENSGNFAAGAQAINMQRVKLNKSYELTLTPSDVMHVYVASLQALQQAQLKLARSQTSLDDATENWQEVEQLSVDSNAEAERTQTAVDALVQAKSNAEESLASAQTDLLDAQSALDEIDTNQALISAHESVLSDSQASLALKTAAAAAATSASTAAEQLHSTAQTALSTAETAVADAIAAAELDENIDASTDADVIAAQAVLQQAQADEIVAGANLAQADALAATAESEAAAAVSAEQTAAATLAQAIADQVPDTEAQAALQQAELAIVANQTNLTLVEQQFDAAHLDASLAETQATNDLADLSSAQSLVDGLTTIFNVATNAVSTTQAIVDSGNTTIRSGCAAELPLQATDNYNCSAIERRIGDSPSSVVESLAEITATQSTLTLLNLFPDYAVTLKPSTGTVTGGVAYWHSNSGAYDPLASDPAPRSWSQHSINGVSVITVEIPGDLQQPGGAKEVLMAEHDHYVRPGMVERAGAVETLTLFNKQALDSILGDF